MKWLSWVAGSALFLVAFPGRAVIAGLPAVADANVSRQVRKELVSLPDYGVFDLLTYEITPKGVVTLGGYARWDSVKAEAEGEVKEIPGVTEVRNKVQILPASTRDERVRWAVYRAIYNDPMLSKYGTGEDGLGRPHFWGKGLRGVGRFWAQVPFLSMEPLGNHAIHIIVRKGRVNLVGQVDNDVDRDLATARARGVFGAFDVENKLLVARATP